MNTQAVSDNAPGKGSAHDAVLANAEGYVMSTLNRRTCHTERKTVGKGWRVWSILGAVPVGAFYGLCVVGYYHLDEPVFGGAYQGIRFGIPGGAAIGALLGFVVGWILDHRTVSCRRQFFLKDIFAATAILAILLWLTKSYVIPVFTYG